MIINERNKTTVPRAFFPSDYKRMEDQGFTPKGWRSYQDSPYKKYQRRLEEHEKSNKDNSRTDRPDS